MSKLNELIIRMNDSSTDYESFKYPAGELQVRLKQETIDALKDAESVVIVANIYNSDDIMKLLLLQDAISSVVPHIREYNLKTVIPYLPYSRADRRFTNGDCLGKNVFLTAIKSVWPNSELYTVDCHSSKFETSYTDIKVDNLLKVVLGNNKNVLFPDLGAKNRYGSIFEGVDGVHVFFCEKKRDPITGKFLGFTVPEDIDKNLETIIIDDICDGGGTFIGIANELKMSREKLSLYVTHGIFSKGLEELSKWFGNIITTETFTNNISVPENTKLEVHNFNFE